MSARSWSSRFALWAAAFALLLKAAAPMLASTAAGLQNVAVGEICSVHGVSLPSAAAEQPAEHGTPSHAEDDCALSALAVLAAAGEPFVSLSLPPAGSDLLPPGVQDVPRRMTWAAAQPRGPPRG